MDHCKYLDLVNCATSKYKPEEKAFFSGIEKEYNFSKFNDKLREVFDVQLIYPEQDLVLVGEIAQVGTLWIQEHCREKLQEKFSNEFIDSVTYLRENIGKSLERIDFKKKGVTAMLHVQEGGIFSGLWQMASFAKCGMEVLWNEILVKQATIEFCELFDLNPYKLYAGGCFLIAADNGHRVIREYEKMGIPCRIIGQVTKDPKKTIVHGEIRRAIMRPEMDELLKVRKGLN